MSMATVTKISTNRTRAFRTRQKNGLRRFSFVAPEVDILNVLTNANILPAWSHDDAAAVERSLEFFMRYVIQVDQEQEN
jgi:hypothetical protein